MGATVMLILVSFAALRHAAATEYAVGDASGWTIGPSYLTWSQKYNFTAGDSLVFNYVPGQHNVYRVTQDAFRTCEPTAKQTMRVWASGHDVVNLTAAGDYYFLCNVTDHCLGGMKFGVAVGVPPPPSPPPPPPPPVMLPPPPPPPSSGASRRAAWASCQVVIGLWVSLLYW